MSPAGLSTLGSEGVLGGVGGAWPREYLCPVSSKLVMIDGSDHTIPQSLTAEIRFVADMWT